LLGFCKISRTINRLVKKPKFLELLNEENMKSTVIKNSFLNPFEKVLI